MLRRRQYGLKLAFNLAQYALAGCLATTVFTVLGRGTALSGAWDWVAALAARRGLHAHRVRLHLRRHAGSPRPPWASASCPACSALSLAVRPRRGRGRPARRGHGRAEPGRRWACWRCRRCCSIAAYRAYAKAREQQNNLRLLHEVTSLLYNSDDAPTALTDFLTAVRGAFRAEVAELVLFGEGDAVPTLSRSRDGEKPVALQLLERREDADRLVAWADRDRRAHHPHRRRAASRSWTATPPGTRSRTRWCRC